MTQNNKLIINYANYLIDSKELCKSIENMLHVYDYDEYFRDAVEADRDARTCLDLVDQIDRQLEIEHDKHLSNLKHQCRCYVNHTVPTGKAIIEFIESAVVDLSDEINVRISKAKIKAKQEILYWAHTSSEDEYDNMSA